jgi:hypothetical protein
LARGGRDEEEDQREAEKLRTELGSKAAHVASSMDQAVDKFSEGAKTKGGKTTLKRAQYISDGLERQQKSE